MNSVLKVLVALMLIGVTACQKEEVVVPELEVSYINMHGTWQLQEWRGAPLEEGSYLYIVFDRKEHGYKIYQKFDSMYARLITGEFTLVNDPKEGYRIEGTYAYGQGDWNQKYLITDFTHERMVWTGAKSQDDCSVYVRCDKVPDDIVAEARAEK